MSPVDDRGGGAAIGLVAIGRNEGERLRACLASVVHRVACVVYVDSGSTDGSVEMARGMGVQVVNLDMSRPFTAARARNEGFAALRQGMPGVRYVQFVDGDCQVVEGWIEAAAEFLERHAGHAAVCGRRRERYPERSIYNKLCDLEWDTPVGDALHCGGDVLMRVGAFVEVDGYRPSLIAGEEPDLCVRLRARGWKIHRLDHEMTLHDAAMTRFGQWWKRAVRAGHAYAEGVWLHGRPPERHWVRELVRAVLWGGLIPLAGLAATAIAGAWGGLVFAVYPLQWLRLALRGEGEGRFRFQWAAFNVLGKVPEFAGAAKFWLTKCRGRQGAIIEYK